MAPLGFKGHDPLDRGDDGGPHCQAKGRFAETGFEDAGNIAEILGDQRLPGLRLHMLVRLRRRLGENRTGEVIGLILTDHCVRASQPEIPLAEF